MSALKIIGLIAAGAEFAALVGGGIWWWNKYKDQFPGRTPSRPAPVPSNPPRPAADTKPRGHMISKPDLDPELRKELDKMFDDGWPPDEETVNNLEPEDVVVFAAESEETGNYTSTRQELITAKVLSVETAIIRARVLSPIAHAEHHGAHAGHGFRVGDLVEVPRSKVLVAARRTDADKTGYGSKGDPAGTFKPSNHTKQTYKVRPATPYDLVLPYRTKELAWYIDRELVTITHVGDKGLLEQVMFTEDSLRGEVSARAIDLDPEVGAVFVGRWDFALDA